MQNPLDDELLEKYAAALLRLNGEAYAAASAVTNDTAQIVQLVTQGVASPVVLAAIERMSKDVDQTDFLPTKSMLAREVWNSAKETMDKETKFKGYKLYADIMGHIAKPAAVSVSTQVNNEAPATVKYIPVQEFADDEAFRRAAQMQQRMLVEGTLYQEPIDVEVEEVIEEQTEVVTYAFTAP